MIDFIPIPCSVCKQPVPSKDYRPKSVEKGECPGCGRQTKRKPEPRHINGLVCGRCVHLHVTWDASMNDVEIWENACQHGPNPFIEGGPPDCKECGIGVMKVIHDVNLHNWCEDCSYPKHSCRCNKDKKKWAGY